MGKHRAVADVVPVGAREVTPRTSAAVAATTNAAEQS
jgi:hypothetical protein